ncbi:hypothetical protein PWEIH_16538 [Listeria weihenstephanensis FSL R9-0317]|uniref:Uncharacterized protein n=1 Tax=Listeria weihenstephanensis TaxID=1006155 RepID=A0A1S7FW81_9LIST|nr:hypothetical protein [Listeria weihenstephanensis]AQY51617.1 hypothetical protein UE46_11630 [Listeria weihenstephanensis]EUJ34859.1 hypothetical protein PWEIH_16538 [Listeria weihenstephanensis FSL R9-0317]
MESHTIEQDFDQFCLARIEGICEAVSNHEEFQEKSKRYYQMRDQLEEFWNPEVIAYLDALEKYQVEAFLYIYREAFKEGVDFFRKR